SPPSLPGSVREAVGGPPSAAPASPERASGLANGRAAHRREIRINESGIEQTVVAFDVTLKSVGHLSRERRPFSYPLTPALPVEKGAGVSDETSHPSSVRGFLLPLAVRPYSRRQLLATGTPIGGHPLPGRSRRRTVSGYRSPVAANEFRSGRACTARLGRSVAPGKRGYK